jgi:hypothetical protein
VVRVTRHPYLLETEGRFTRGSRPGRTFGESVGGILKWTALIGRTEFDTIPSIPDPTLSLNIHIAPSCEALNSVSEGHTMQFWEVLESVSEP